MKEPHITIIVVSQRNAGFEGDLVITTISLFITWRTHPNLSYALPGASEVLRKARSMASKMIFPARRKIRRENPSIIHFLYSISIVI